MVDIPKLFLEQAKLKRRKIGVGIMRPIQETVASLKKAAKYADIVVVGPKIRDFDNVVEDDQDKASELLIKLLKDGKVEGIVRGQLKDSYTLDEYHRQFGKKPLPANRKVGAAVLHKNPYTIVVCNASIYQGHTLEDKKYEVERVIKYMQEDLDLSPKIGVMSSLRPTSHRSEFPILDQIAALNTELTEYLQKKGYDAKEFYFEYETAVWSGCNLIVPSMGLVGNAWLKALLYLGGWELLACPYFDLGVVYEDGTRNEKDFFWHIVHAVAMCNSRGN